LGNVVLSWQNWVTLLKLADSLTETDSVFFILVILA
jgi:hypothetical protein